MDSLTNTAAAVADASPLAGVTGHTDHLFPLGVAVVCAVLFLVVAGYLVTQTWWRRYFAWWNDTDASFVNNPPENAFIDHGNVQIAWRVLPSWINCVARDYNGAWYGYHSTPHGNGHMWAATDNYGSVRISRHEITVRRNGSDLDIYHRPAYQYAKGPTIELTLEHWSQVPAWVQHVCRNYDGSVMGFERRPTADVKRGRWLAGMFDNERYDRLTGSVADALRPMGIDAPWYYVISTRPVSLPGFTTHTNGLRVKWDKLPDWAAYVARQADGTWVAFECRPEPYTASGIWTLPLSKTRSWQAEVVKDGSELINFPESWNIHWTHTLTERPSPVKCRADELLAHVPAAVQQADAGCAEADVDEDKPVDEAGADPTPQSGAFYSKTVTTTKTTYEPAANPAPEAGKPVPVKEGPDVYTQMPGDERLEVCWIYVPAWVQYVARSSGGIWQGFSARPSPVGTSECGQWTVLDGRTTTSPNAMFRGEWSLVNWTHTLVARPADTSPRHATEPTSQSLDLSVYTQHPNGALVAWPYIPSKARYIAKSASGVWQCFTSKPVLQDGLWHGDQCDLSLPLSADTVRGIQPSWWDSIIERPASVTGVSTTPPATTTLKLPQVAKLVLAQCIGNAEAENVSRFKHMTSYTTINWGAFPLWIQHAVRVTTVEGSVWYASENLPVITESGLQFSGRYEAITGSAITTKSSDPATGTAACLYHRVYPTQHAAYISQADWVKHMQSLLPVSPRRPEAVNQQAAEAEPNLTGTPFPWDQVPNHINYVAVTRTRVWIGFNGKPQLKDGAWFSATDGSPTGEVLYIPGAKTDKSWDESLIERPKPATPRIDNLIDTTVYINWQAMPDWARYIAHDGGRGWTLMSHRPGIAGGKRAPLKDYSSALNHKLLKLQRTVLSTAAVFERTLFDPLHSPNWFWSTQPEWATWAAMDVNGRWFVYSHEPVVRHNTWSLRDEDIKNSFNSKYDVAVGAAEGTPEQRARWTITAIQRNSPVPTLIGTSTEAASQQAPAEFKGHEFKGQEFTPDPRVESPAVDWPERWAKEWESLWADKPAWVKWAAMDANGTWRTFSHKPKLSLYGPTAGTWVPQDPPKGQVDPEVVYAFTYADDRRVVSREECAEWQWSLLKRPETAPASRRVGSATFITPETLAPLWREMYYSYIVQRRISDPSVQPQSYAWYASEGKPVFCLDSDNWIFEGDGGVEKLSPEIIAKYGDALNEAVKGYTWNGVVIAARPLDEKGPQGANSGIGCAGTNGGIGCAGTPVPAAPTEPERTQSVCSDSGLDGTQGPRGSHVDPWSKLPDWVRSLEYNEEKDRWYGFELYEYDSADVRKIQVPTEYVTANWPDHPKRIIRSTTTPVVRDWPRIWSELSSRIQYVAMDRGGSWNGYRERPKPNLQDGVWSNVPEYLPDIPHGYEFEQKNWTSTLRQRPTVDPEMVKQVWSVAPEWAQYVAMDSDGFWCAYARQPGRIWKQGCWRSDARWTALSNTGTRQLSPSARAFWGLYVFPRSEHTVYKIAAPGLQGLWSSLPKDFKYLARNSDKRWTAFTTEPSSTWDRRWICQGSANNRRLIRSTVQRYSLDAIVDEYEWNKVLIVKPEPESEAPAPEPPAESTPAAPSGPVELSAEEQLKRNLEAGALAESQAPAAELTEGLGRPEITGPSDPATESEPEGEVKTTVLLTAPETVHFWNAMPLMYRYAARDSDGVWHVYGGHPIAHEDKWIVPRHNSVARLAKSTVEGYNLDKVISAYAWNAALLVRPGMLRVQLFKQEPVSAKEPPVEPVEQKFDRPAEPESGVPEHILQKVDDLSQQLTEQLSKQDVVLVQLPLAIEVWNDLKGYRYIGRNRDGSWHAFRARPTVNVDSWEARADSPGYMVGPLEERHTQVLESQVGQRPWSTFLVVNGQQVLLDEVAGLEAGCQPPVREVETEVLERQPEKPFPADPPARLTEEALAETTAAVNAAEASLEAQEKAEKEAIEPKPAITLENLTSYMVQTVDTPVAEEPVVMPRKSIWSYPDSKYVVQRSDGKWLATDHAPILVIDSSLEDEAYWLASLGNEHVSESGMGTLLLESEYDLPVVDDWRKSFRAAPGPWRTTCLHRNRKTAYRFKWSKLPEQYMYVAMDLDYTWHAFVSRPHTAAGRWTVAGGGDCIRLSEAEAPYYDTDMHGPTGQLACRIQWDSHPYADAWAFSKGFDGKWYFYTAPPRLLRKDNVFIWETRHQKYTAMMAAELNEAIESTGVSKLHAAATLTFRPGYRRVLRLDPVKKISRVVVDKTKLPPNTKYVARDANGVWYGYAEKPTRKYGAYNGWSGLGTYLGDDVARTAGSVAWDESLREVK